ncbi:MAG: tetratricopeptide repeat protein [Elusimicrobiales bacterium]|nr:tetratricopeptide repeat protein [Elusimicrobiales bacterium]
MRTLLLALLLLPVGAAAYDRGELTEFNDMYRSGDYQDALDGYKQVITKEPSNQWGYYNAGNALYRLNRPGQAVYNYARAFMLDPRDGDIRANLEFALRQTGQTLVPEGAPAALHYAYYFVAEAELKALALLLLWLACLAGAACFLLDGNKLGVAAGRASAGAALLLLLTLAWLGARQSSPFSSAGVVTRTGGTRMLSGPGENFKTYASAPEGRIVKILDTGDEAYYEIGLPKEGIKGWALKTDIERL